MSKNKRNTDIFYSAHSDTLIGKKTRNLLDLDTGEKLEVEQITKRIYGRKFFWKVYLCDFLQILGVLDSKQVDILIYILERTNSATNVFIGTWKKIEQDLSVSHMTVSKVFRKLQESDFLTKVQNGVWMVSPAIMMKGKDFKQKLLIEYYDETKKSVESETDEIKDCDKDENID